MACFETGQFKSVLSIQILIYDGLAIKKGQSASVLGLDNLGGLVSIFLRGKRVFTSVIRVDTLPS